MLLKNLWDKERKILCIPKSKQAKQKVQDFGVLPSVKSLLEAPSEVSGNGLKFFNTLNSESLFRFCFWFPLASKVTLEYY